MSELLGPEYACNCGDIFTTPEDMDYHLHALHLIEAASPDDFRLDVERLARALNRLPSSIGSMVVQYPTADPRVWRHVPIVEAIAAAYAALGEEQG